MYMYLTYILHNEFINRDEKFLFLIGSQIVMLLCFICTKKGNIWSIKLYCLFEIYYITIFNISIGVHSVVPIISDLEVLVIPSLTTQSQRSNILRFIHTIMTSNESKRWINELMKILNYPSIFCLYRFNV